MGRWRPGVAFLAFGSETVVPLPPSVKPVVNACCKRCTCASKSPMSLRSPCKSVVKSSKRRVNAASRARCCASSCCKALSRCSSRVVTRSPFYRLSGLLHPLPLSPASGGSCRRPAVLARCNRIIPQGALYIIGQGLPVAARKLRAARCALLVEGLAWSAIALLMIFSAVGGQSLQLGGKLGGADRIGGAILDLLIAGVSWVELLPVVQTPFEPYPATLGGKVGVNLHRDVILPCTGDGVTLGSDIRFNPVAVLDGASVYGTSHMLCDGFPNIGFQGLPFAGGVCA